MKVDDKILNFLKFSGPSLAMRIAKNIEQDSIIASAYLSELVEQRKIKISNLKIGTSPLYYLPGQEDQLIKFTSEINPKDLDVLERLKKEKVIREDGQELLTKVALRNLKDFAIPLQVNINGNREIFWKFYLAGDEEVNQSISEIMGFSTPGQEEVTEQVTAEVPVEETKPVEENPKSEEVTESQTEVKEELNEKPTVTYPPDTTKKVVEEKTYDTYPPNTSEKVVVEDPVPEYPPKTMEEVEIEKKEVAEEKEVIENKKVKETSVEERQTEEKEQEIKEKHKAEVQKELSEVALKEEKEELEEKFEEEDKKESKEKVVEEPKIEKKEVEEKKSIVSKLKEKIVGKKKKSKVQDKFLPIIESYFRELDINIENMETIRKNSEINFYIKVPSVVGRLTYYCKAKKKKRCDEKDISAAYMEAQMKKMPLLFLYSDGITKKAEEMLESEAFDNLIVKKIEE